MHWLAGNWFNIVQSVALVATLTIAISALRSSGQATRGSNILAIMSSHREIWSQLTTNPELQDVMRSTMSGNEEISNNEYNFFIQVINHVATAFELAQMGGINPVEGMRRDAHEYMNWPVFRAAWGRNKAYQEPNFVEFIDSCIAGVDLDKPVGRRPNIIRQAAKKVRLAFFN